MMSSWTAFSQITGISKDQKIEIVSTLEAYPIVLQQVKIQSDIIVNYEKIVKDNARQLSLCDDETNKLQEVIFNNEKQIDNLNLQLKSAKKGGWEIPLSIGFLLGVIFTNIF